MRHGRKETLTYPELMTAIPVSMLDQRNLIHFSCRQCTLNKGIILCRVASCCAAFVSRGCWNNIPPVGLGWAKSELLFELRHFEVSLEELSSHRG